MSSAQKTIKYLAFAFAIFLIVSIFTAIASVIIGLSKGFFVLDKPTSSKVNHDKYTTYMDISLKYSNLKIVEGETLKVENDNSSIKVKLNSNKLVINDKSKWFSKNKDSDLIVYVPKNIKFDIVSINAGAGKISVDGFNTKKLLLNLGAGNSKIKNIISDKTSIDTGAGDVKINSSILNDANIDLGIGNISINSDITGESKIDCGIGNVKLYLPKDLNNYSFKFDKGIGSIKLNNRNISEDKKYGNGNSFIDIDGGIGDISVNTK